jgi:hypothetical protein
MTPHRRTWPKGLRVIFWLGVVGFGGSTGQLIYWILVTSEFFPEVTVQGGYAVIGYALALITVSAGVLSCRRVFTVGALITAVFHLGATIYFNYQILDGWLPEMIAGRWQFLYEWNATTWVYTWNWICIIWNGAVAYYLAGHEFRVFRIWCAGENGEGLRLD